MGPTENVNKVAKSVWDTEGAYSIPRTDAGFASRLRRIEKAKLFRIKSIKQWITECRNQKGKPRTAVSRILLNTHPKTRISEFELTLLKLGYIIEDTRQRDPEEFQRLLTSLRAATRVRQLSNRINVELSILRELTEKSLQVRISGKLALMEICAGLTQPRAWTELLKWTPDYLYSFHLKAWVSTCRKELRSKDRTKRLQAKQFFDGLNKNLRGRLQGKIPTTDYWNAFLLYRELVDRIRNYRRLKTRPERLKFLSTLCLEVRIEKELSSLIESASRRHAETALDILEAQGILKARYFKKAVRPAMQRLEKEYPEIRELWVIGPLLDGITQSPQTYDQFDLWAYLKRFLKTQS